jgi:MFS family permease
VLRSEQRTGPGSGRRGEPLTPQEQPGDRSASETIRTAGLDPRGLQRVLVVLCVTEITSWGVLYYALPVLAPAIAADTGWSIPGVTGAFSAGLVVSALVGVPVGRWLDRIGPRLVMTAGSVLAVPAVAMIALAGTFPVFVAGWLLAGVAMAGTLYPPAFAALTRWWGPRRVTALTGLTLLAGLASTVFAPVTAALLTGLGWRHTYLVLALVLALVTIPAHLLGLRGPWPPSVHADSAVAELPPRQVVRSRPFLLLVATITAGTFAAFAVVVNQVPLFLERGLSTSTAAWALGLGGVGQVTGRLFYRRWPCWPAGSRPWPGRRRKPNAGRRSPTPLRSTSCQWMAPRRSTRRGRCCGP